MDKIKSMKNGIDDFYIEIFLKNIHLLIFLIFLILGQFRMIYIIFSDVIVSRQQRIKVHHVGDTTPINFGIFYDYFIHFLYIS